MTNNQQCKSGTQVGTQISHFQKPKFSAALKPVKSRERNRERRNKNRGFLRVLRSRPFSIPGNVTEFSKAQNTLKPLFSKAFAFFAPFPLPETYSRPKLLILLDSYVPEIPIYYIYRRVLANTPYKYNLGLGLVGFCFVGGAS